MIEYEQLYDALWGEDDPENPFTLDPSRYNSVLRVYICEIRRLLPDGWAIRAISNTGYVLEPDRSGGLKGGRRQPSVRFPGFR